ncbi:helix-turn-helix domain-containing protein [Paenibacillus daejeonensis]|uniref:helix-turn-helix domain-containing protein n=1 Tax=Paenibacillus daejeonensis TaxID=135193 RepID=UPI000374FF43|nr:AraC family transcriptional regulator [Paenibacillus daejeonensis]
MEAVNPFWKQYIAKVQLDVSMAAYSKVSRAWQEHDFVPEFNKMYFVLEGEGYLKVGDRTYYPKPGELYLLPAGELQSYGTISEDTFGKYWCHFTALLGDLPLFRLIRVPICIRPELPEEMADLFRQLIRYKSSNALTAELHVRSLLLSLIAQYVEQSGPVQMNLSAAPSHDKMGHVLSYIDNHLTTNMTVEELAQIAHFHPNYFIRVFKHFTGLSPIQYINRQRLEKAKDQLTLTELSVAMVAESLGMEPAYFSRMFKEHTGFSPRGYRDWVMRQNPI